MENNKKLSMAEFRAWLAGIEEMQDEEWSPDRKQWLKIRAKINLVEGVEVSANTQYPTSFLEAPKPQSLIRGAEPERTAMQPTPGRIPLAHDGTPMVPLTSGLGDAASQAKMTTMMPMPAQPMPQMPSGPRMDRPPSLDGVERVATPSIDTSSGQYQSQFI